MYPEEPKACLPSRNGIFATSEITCVFSPCSRAVVYSKQVGLVKYYNQAEMAGLFTRFIITIITKFKLITLVNEQDHEFFWDTLIVIVLA